MVEHKATFAEKGFTRAARSHEEEETEEHTDDDDDKKEVVARLSYKVRFNV